MTDETARIVRELRHKASKVTSFIADYQSISSLLLFPLETKAKVFFLSPDRCRSEAFTNGRQIITIRKGNIIQRCIPQKNEIWRYDLADLPQSEPINYSVADFSNPFFAADESTIQYEGLERLPGASAQVFFGNTRNWSKHGLLDTRKGFSIPYQQKHPQFKLRLYINENTGILRRIVGIDRNGKQVLRTDYLMQSVNVRLLETLFAFDESTAKYKVVHFSDIILASLNPDSAEAPPSIN
jgi:outer membrane lipoprotein-sorting protein